MVEVEVVYSMYYDRLLNLNINEHQIQPAYIAYKMPDNIFGIIFIKFSPRFLLSRKAVMGPRPIICISEVMPKLSGAASRRELTVSSHIARGERWGLSPVIVIVPDDGDNEDDDDDPPPGKGNPKLFGSR